MHDPTETCPHGQPLGDFSETVLGEFDDHRITAAWLSSTGTQRPEDAWLRLTVWTRAVDANGQRGGWRIDPVAGVSLPCAAVDALRALLTRLPAPQSSGCDRHPSAWVDDLCGRLTAATLDGCHYCLIDSLHAEARRAALGVEVLRERVVDLVLWAQGAAMALDEVFTEDCVVRTAMFHGSTNAGEVAAFCARLMPAAIAAEVARRQGATAPWYERRTATDDQDDAVREEMARGIPGRRTP